MSSYWIPYSLKKNSFHFAAEHDREYVELPPELCHVILAPISVDMIYSYKFMPSVMQRVESLLIALNLKKNIPKVNIPTIKVQLYNILFNLSCMAFSFSLFF